MRAFFPTSSKSLSLMCSHEGNWLSWFSTFLEKLPKHTSFARSFWTMCLYVLEIVFYHSLYQHLPTIAVFVSICSEFTLSYFCLSLENGGDAPTYCMVLNGIVWYCMVWYGIASMVRTFYHHKNFPNERWRMRKLGMLWMSKAKKVLHLLRLSLKKQ